jgi:acetyl esterase/lipase
MNPGRLRLVALASLACALGAALALLAGCGNGHVTHVPSTTGKQPASSEGKPRESYGKPANGAPPRALVMLIHGGGWVGLNPAAYKQELDLAPQFEGLGYETLTVDYRKGLQGIKDVYRFYEQARKKVGPDVPICAIGPSAGGHISLMLAVRFDDLACAISLDGPTDLPALAHEDGGEEAYKLATDAFGSDTSTLSKLSPALHASAIKAKVMLVYAQNDPVVPVAQAHEMADALPGSQLIVLPPGSNPFVHSIGGGTSGVDPDANAQAQQEQLQFLDSVASAAGR